MKVPTLTGIAKAQIKADTEELLDIVVTLRITSDAKRRMNEIIRRIQRNAA